MIVQMMLRRDSTQPFSPQKKSSSNRQARKEVREDGDLLRIQKVSRTVIVCYVQLNKV